MDWIVQNTNWRANFKPKAEEILHRALVTAVTLHFCVFVITRSFRHVVLNRLWRTFSTGSNVKTCI